MIATDDFARHEEVWLLLPWLANGRLAQGEREKAEEHVRLCPGCAEELTFQHLPCDRDQNPEQFMLRECRCGRRGI